MKEKHLRFSEFFKLFIAVHLMKGNSYLNVDSFKGFLKRHYEEYLHVLPSFNSTLTRLVSSNIVSFDFEENNILLTNKDAILKLADDGKYDLSQIYKVAESYDEYCKEETARAYDMMIEPEAIAQYNREIDRKIQDEVSAHARYGHL